MSGTFSPTEAAQHGTTQRKQRDVRKLCHGRVQECHVASLLHILNCFHSCFSKFAYVFYSVSACVVQTDRSIAFV